MWKFLKKKPGRRKRRTVEENVKRYEDLLREGTDDLISPLDRFYRECRGEGGDEDAELVILGLEQLDYTVRVVEHWGFWQTNLYIWIAR